MSRRRTPRSRREIGAAAVEFALILPILLLLLGGIVDYGRFFFTQVQLTNAAREGARAGIGGATSTQAIARMTTAGGAAPGWVAPTVALSPAATPVTCVNAAANTNYIATTSAGFRFFFAGILPGVPQTTTITSSATMGCT